MSKFYLITGTGFGAAGLMEGINAYINPEDGDNDNDGVPDAIDADDDNDCIPDAKDPDPYVWTPSKQSEHCCQSHCGAS